MRYPASEKLEIIRLVEGSHLSARLTLAKLGIPRTTFYRWYDRYLQRGEAGLKDQSPKLKHVWNRIPYKGHEAFSQGTLPPPNTRQDLTFALDPEEPHSAGTLLTAGRPRSPD